MLNVLQTFFFIGASKVYSINTAKLTQKILGYMYTTV
jgi:hypothetical protein